MKELETFRKFLAEGQLNENKLTPAVVDFLKAMMPEDIPGSFDDEKNDFVVPFSYEDLVHTEEDLLDTSTTLVYMERDGMKLSDLPTEYVEFETYELPIQGGKAIARNFAKFVPGEGLYYKVTSEEPKGETVKEAYTPQGVEVRDVKDFIGELQDSINLAQNYLNGKYDQDEMSTTVLINDLEERLRMMADEFPSYKGGL